MTEGPVTVVLTDGESNLAHFMDLLRSSGRRVLATSRPYEVILFVARNPVANVILRASLLPRPPEDFLRQLRDFQPSPFVVLTTPAAETPPSTSALVDLLLSEPFRFSAILEALEYGSARSGSEASEPESKAATGALPVSTGRFLSAAPRLIACARRLSELERDRDRLLTTALEMFLELGDAERGSIMLRGRGGSALELVRRSGFPDDVGPLDPIEIGSSLAGEVALTGRPLVVQHVDTPTRAAYHSGSFMIVPLLDRKTVVGVVNLTDRRGGEVFTEEDLEVVSLLAAQVAVNLGNAENWEDLHRMAVVDPLTGLFNRRFFDRQISVELERARRYDRQVTLALVDIDHFKVINDINGYAAGDSLIRLVSEVIRRNFREVDVVTRWGGDEFAILLPETGKPPIHGAAEGVVQGLNYVERLRRAVEEQDFRQSLPSLTGRITVSAGVATFPVDGQDPKALFSKANQALKRAKRAGNNRVCVCGDEGATPRENVV